MGGPACLRSGRNAGAGLTAHFSLLFDRLGGLGALDGADGFDGIVRRCGDALERLGKFVFDAGYGFDELVFFVRQPEQAAEGVAGDVFDVHVGKRE